MAAETTLDYDSPPPVAPAYVRAVTASGGGLGGGESIPAIRARISGMRVNARKLADYRRVCGFGRSAQLPLTYPHVLAFPVHMAVMTHADFPLKLLGLVHVRNRIEQQRAIGTDEALDLSVRVGGHRDVHNGVEFDLTTEYSDSDNRVIWTGTSTMLSRGKGRGRKPSRAKEAEPALESAHYATWDAPANIGRRYAGCAGDYNPIHLSALSAKLFGFPRAIAHGMWLKARTAAELAPQLQQEHVAMQVAFKRPVLLPASLMLKYAPGDGGTDFLLSDPDGETRHMTGRIEYL